MNLLQSLQKSLSKILKFSDHSVEGYFGSGIFCFGFINASVSGESLVEVYYWSQE